MVRKRGDGGRFVKSSSGARGAAKSFRISSANAEKLKQIAESRGVFEADLFNSWVESGCPMSSIPDLEQLKKQALAEFQRIERVGTQSAAFKKAKKAVDLLIDAIQESM